MYNPINAKRLSCVVTLCHSILPQLEEITTVHVISTSLFAAHRYRMVLCSVLTLLQIICKLIMAENKERTFIMVKPDGVQRSLVGKIIQRFEEKGFKLVAIKMLWVSDSLCITSLCSYPDFTEIDQELVNVPRGSWKLYFRR